MKYLHRFCIAAAIAVAVLTVGATVADASSLVGRPPHILPVPHPLPPWWWHWPPVPYPVPYPMPYPVLLSNPYGMPVTTAPTYGNPDTVSSSESITIPNNRAVLEVRLPAADAQLWLDGKEITGTGVSRRFLTPELLPGQLYRSRLVASWLESGRLQTRTFAVELRAGATVRADFSRNGN